METDSLLLPIAAHSPCGEDLSFSREFDQIAEMRRADDPSLDQGAWVTTLKQADWPGVARQCSELLRTRTKDLRLAMWLAEARALSEGHRGLAEGLRACAALCEQHWAELHPRPESDDQEERIGNIAWLLQRVVDIAPALSITQGRQGERLSLRDLSLARQHDARAAEPGSGTHSTSGQAAHHSDQPIPLTAARFRQALADTPAAQLRQTLAAQHEAEAALLAWEAVVDAQLGRDGPSFVAAREALAQATHDLTRLLRDVGVAPLTDGQSGAASNAGTSQMGQAARHSGAPAQANHANPVGPHSQASSPSGVLRAPHTRNEALQQLRDVAAFFRQTEPHSPVAYLAEKAVKWGEMPLHQWLQEVVKDPGSMGHLHELLGIDTHGGSEAG
jgi:type VI secretion system protein ImpA